MISLLAVTGLRTGEALALDVADVDLDSALITVRGKYDRTRLVPLHPTTARMLRDYRARCDQLCPAPASPSFFLSATGTRPFPSAAHATFARLLARAGITRPRRSTTCTPPPNCLGLAAQRLHAHQAGGPCANAGMGAGDAPLGSQEES